MNIERLRTYLKEFLLSKDYPSDSLEFSYSMEGDGPFAGLITVEAAVIDLSTDYEALALFIFDVDDDKNILDKKISKVSQINQRRRIYSRPLIPIYIVKLKEDSPSIGSPFPLEIRLYDGVIMSYVFLDYFPSYNKLIDSLKRTDFHWKIFEEQRIAEERKSEEKRKDDFLNKEKEFIKYELKQKQILSNRRASRTSLIVFGIGMILTLSYAVFYYKVNQNKNFQVAIGDSLTRKINNLEKQLHSSPPIILADSSENKSSVVKYEKRLKALEESFLNSPERSLAIVKLNQDIEMLKKEVDHNKELTANEVSHLSSIDTFVIGTAISVVSAFLGFVFSFMNNNGALFGIARRESDNS